MSESNNLPGLIISEDTRGMAVGATGGLSTGIILGTSNKGKIGIPERISSTSQLRELFGEEDVWDMSVIATKTPLGLIRACKLYLKHSNDLYAMRVASSSANKAAVNILPDIEQYQEFIGDGATLIFTLKVIPETDAITGKITTVLDTSGSYVVVFDPVGAIGAGEVGVFTTATPAKEGTIEFAIGEAPTDGDVIAVNFNLNITDPTTGIKVATISGKTEGDWAHQIEMYIVSTDEQATIEDQTIDGDTGVDAIGLAKLLYDNVPKSVVNAFYIQNKTTPSDRKTLRGIYINSDILNWSGEKTDSDAVDDTTVKIAQTFTTVDAISIDEIIIRARQDLTNDDINMRIETVNTLGEPTGTLVHANATGTILGVDLAVAYANMTVKLAGTINLSANTIYAIVLDKSSGTDTFEVEAIDYATQPVPKYYYENGKYLTDLTGIGWSDTGEENSLIFAVRPLMVSGQLTVIMRSWGDPRNRENVARIIVNSIENQIITDYNIHAKYRVNANSNISKLVVNYQTQSEEYIITSGRDLARDINNGSALLEATEDSVNYNILPSITLNGTEEFPLTPSGGDNGDEATPLKYNDSLTIIETTPENIYFVMIASQGRYNYQAYNSMDGTDDLLQIHVNLIAHVRLMNTRNYWRLAICGMRQKLSTETIGEFAESGIDSIASRLDTIADNKGLLHFVGHGIQVTEESPFTTDSIAYIPGVLNACLYAGLFSSLPDNQNTTREYLNGVIDLEFEMNYGTKVIFTNLGVVGYEKAGGIRVIRGITTDPDKKFFDASIRRIVHHVYARELAELDPLINQLNEPTLWSLVKTKIMTLFISLTNQKYIQKNWLIEVGASQLQRAEGIVELNQTFETVRPVSKFKLNTQLQ